MSKKYIFILIGILLILISFLLYRNQNLSSQLDRASQNYAAAQDTIKVLTLKNNELLYEKQAYILKESELESHINITEDEIKEMKKQLKTSIDYISKIEGMVHIDTIYTADTLTISNDTIYNKFIYNDLWISLEGNSTIYPHTGHSSTSINSIYIPLQLQTGLTDSNSIFVKTDNPYVDIIGLDGAVIDQSKFKATFRTQIYAGAGFQYGLFNKSFDFGPQIGIGFKIEF